MFRFRAILTGCPSGCWLDQGRTAQGFPSFALAREAGSSAVAPTQAVLSLTLKGYNAGARSQAQSTKDRKLSVGRSDNTQPIGKRNPSRFHAREATHGRGLVSHLYSGSQPACVCKLRWSRRIITALYDHPLGCAVCFNRITSLTLIVYDTRLSCQE